MALKLLDIYLCYTASASLARADGLMEIYTIAQHREHNRVRPAQTVSILLVIAGKE